MAKTQTNINGGVLAAGLVVVIGGAVAALVGSSDFMHGVGVGIAVAGAVLLGFALSKKV